MKIRHLAGAFALLFVLSVNGAPALAHEGEHDDHDRIEHHDKHHEHDGDRGEHERGDHERHADKARHDGGHNGKADESEGKSKWKKPSWWPF